MRKRLIQRVVHNLAREVAKEKGLQMKEALQIVTSQFDYVKSEMESGVKDDESSYKTILLKYFGTFTFNKGRFDAIRRNLKKKNND